MGLYYGGVQIQAALPSNRVLLHPTRLPYIIIILKILVSNNKQSAQTTKTLSTGRLTVCTVVCRNSVAVRIRHVIPSS